MLFKYKNLFYFIFIVLIGFYANKLVKIFNGVLSFPIARGNILEVIPAYATVITDRNFAFNPFVLNSISQKKFKVGEVVKKGTPLIQTADKVIIRAPFNGIVHFHPYKLRENIFSENPIIVLTDITDRYLEVKINLSELSRVRVGQKVKIFFSVPLKKSFWGKVSKVTQNSNQLILRVDSTEFPDDILPNMKCNLEIIIGEKLNKILIPLSALDDGYIWVSRKKSFPKKTHVDLGITHNNWAEVLSGDILVGDQVIIN